MILIENYEKKDYTVVKNQRLSLTVWLPGRVASIIQRPSTGRVDAKHCCRGNLAGLAAQETCIDGAETNLLVGNKQMPQLEKLCCSHTHFSSKRNVSQCSTFFTFRYFGYPENITMVPSLAIVYCVPLKGTWRFLECWSSTLIDQAEDG